MTRRMRLGVCALLFLAGCQRGGSVPVVVTGPKSPAGWEVRYNATVALARRGSDKVKDEGVWDNLTEMLDEGQQLRNFRREAADGKEVSEAGSAHLTVITAQMLTNVEVNGQPLDDKKTYTLATNTFVALKGGDGYTMFEGAKVLVNEENGPVEPVILINAISEEKEIAPQTDGRIKRVN